jgi:hypothetical protein
VHQPSVTKRLAERFVKLWLVSREKLDGLGSRVHTESSGHGSQRPKGLQVTLVSSCSAAQVMSKSINLNSTVRHYKITHCSY